jgi:hypothetical protein
MFSDAALLESSSDVQLVRLETAIVDTAIAEISLPQRVQHVKMAPPESALNPAAPDLTSVGTALPKSISEMTPPESTSDGAPPDSVRNAENLIAYVI